MRRLSTAEFIERALRAHGNRFSYARVEYRGSHIKVKIQCHEHGVFEQTPRNHWLGQGCPRCAGKGITTTEWINRARAVHGGTYGYSLVEYVAAEKPVKIICAKHGPFEQTPVVHVRDRCGCGKCAGYGLTDAEWKARAREIHGDVYDYSKFVYVHQQIKCKIICTVHGVFEQTVLNHIYNRAGCPLCGGSKGEKLVARTLDRLCVRYVPQWSDPSCRHVSLLLFDFYLPSYGALIEFDGLQHFEPVRWHAAMSDAEAEALHVKVLERDRIKNQWAATNGLPLLRVSKFKTAVQDVSTFVESLRGDKTKKECAA